MTTDEITSGLNASTGIREDDDNNYATELIHKWTSSGTGILLSPRDIAEIKVRNKFGADRTFTPEDVSDSEFHARDGLNNAWRYTGGKNGARQYMPVCLNPNDGLPSADCEWLVAIANPDTSISRQKVGRYGILRLKPNAVDRRGKLHTLELTEVKTVKAETGVIYTNLYLNGSPTTAHNIEGFVAGFAYAEDLREWYEELTKATNTLRTITRRLEREANPAEDLSVFRDKPPTDCGY